jgi:hypothetical protein
MSKDLVTGFQNERLPNDSRDGHVQVISYNKTEWPDPSHSILSQINYLTILLLLLPQLLHN